MALGADVMHADGDLAVGLLAQRAAVLPLHSDGVLALLGERNVIEDEDASAAGKGVSQDRAVACEDVTVVPGALGEELLQRLLGVQGSRQVLRQSDPAGQRLSTLAFAVDEQTLQVDRGPASRPSVGELLNEQRSIVAQPLKD